MAADLSDEVMKQLPLMLQESGSHVRKLLGVWEHMGDGKGEPPSPSLWTTDQLIAGGHIR